MTRIAFIGLGNMGGPMAANLVKAGHSVTGFDLSAAALDALSKNGGKKGASASETVSGDDVVVTMLPAGPHVRSAYTDKNGIIASVKPGTLLIDCSTID